MELMDWAGRGPMALQRHQHVYFGRASSWRIGSIIRQADRIMAAKQRSPKASQQQAAVFMLEECAAQRRRRR